MRPAKFKPKPDRSKAAERERALQRIKAHWRLQMRNSEWNPESEPRISSMLKSVEGGIEHCIEALRAHDDEDARLFLGVWDRCTRAC
jgi:tellurite resistance protein